jgi:hypothetical protein
MAKTIVLRSKSETKQFVPHPTGPHKVSKGRGVGKHKAFSASQLCRKEAQTLALLVLKHKLAGAPGRQIDQAFKMKAGELSKLNRATRSHAIAILRSLG